jgi:hypothetical protein
VVSPVIDQFWRSIQWSTILVGGLCPDIEVFGAGWMQSPKPHNDAPVLERNASRVQGLRSFIHHALMGRVAKFGLRSDWNTLAHRLFHGSVQPILRVALWAVAGQVNRRDIS